MYAPYTLLIWEEAQLIDTRSKNMICNRPTSFFSQHLNLEQRQKKAEASWENLMSDWYFWAACFLSLLCLVNQPFLLFCKLHSRVTIVAFYAHKSISVVCHQRVLISINRLFGLTNTSDGGPFQWELWPVKCWRQGRSILLLCYNTVHGVGSWCKWDWYMRAF